jgi:2-oxoisovalerate dehydrogenase E1 component alpha subunit
MGPTMIEWVTLRVGAHSTSDDPTAYRPADEAASFPLGDPIDRLRGHLVAIGEWDDERHTALSDEVDLQVSTAFAEADANGSVKTGHVSDPRTMFDDVYATMPRHLREQRDQVGR